MSDNDWIDAAIEACADYADGHSDDWEQAEEGSEKEIQADIQHERFARAVKKLFELKGQSERVDTLIKVIKDLQIALGNFCCDNCISETDLEEDHPDLLAASVAADEVLYLNKGFDGLSDCDPCDDGLPIADGMSAGGPDAV